MRSRNAASELSATPQRPEAMSTTFSMVSCAPPTWTAGFAASEGSGLISVAQGERRRSSQHLARGQPGIEREQRDAGERAGDPQLQAGRQVELEDTPRDELADAGRPERGEQAGDGAHGE